MPPKKSAKSPKPKKSAKSPAKSAKSPAKSAKSKPKSKSPAKARSSSHSKLVKSRSSVSPSKHSKILHKAAEHKGFQLPANYDPIASTLKGISLITNGINSGEGYNKIIQKYGHVVGQTTDKEVSVINKEGKTEKYQIRIDPTGHMVIKGDHGLSYAPRM